MPTFTETKTLTSLKLVPAMDIIITEHEVATLKDGVVITKATEGRSYSNMQIADFEMDVSPTGGTLLEIVEAFNAAAQTAKDEALTALKTAQDALAASEAKVASLQAQIDAYTPPVPAKTVAVVSMRQARLALNAAGLLDAVEAAVASSTKDVQIEWEFSSELRRDWPTLVLLAGALGLTDAQLDALFIQAATL